MNNNFNNNNPNKQVIYKSQNFSSLNSNQRPISYYQNNTIYPKQKNRNFAYSENYQPNNIQQNYNYNNYSNNTYGYSQQDGFEYQNDLNRFNYNHHYVSNNIQQPTNYNATNKRIHSNKYMGRKRTPIINKDPLNYIKRNGVVGIDYYGTIPNEKRYDMYLYTLIELNNMGISVENTTKKFYMGKMYYKLTDEYLNYLSNVQNGTYSSYEKYDSSYNQNNNIDSNNDKFSTNEENINSTINEFVVNKKQNEFEKENESISEENKFFDDKEFYFEDFNLNENEFYDENINSYNDWNYINEDELNGTVSVEGDIPEDDDFHLENLINNHNEMFFRKNKSLDTDLEYKIFGLCFNKDGTDQNVGKLDNVNFDIYPKDRIMLLSSDQSKSSVTLIDVLTRRFEKQSGYIYFNIKTKQKWIDMYSEEFKQYDLEMINKKSDVLFQFESPDYFSYGSKKDTPLSLLKKISYAIDITISKSLLEKLIDIFDFKSLIKTRINEFMEAQKIIFTLMCDILIGKHVLLIPLTEFIMEINKKIEFFNLLNDINKNKSTIIIFSSWDILDAKIFANRVLCLDNGKVVLDKKINDILKVHDSLDKFLLNYLQNKKINNNE